MDGLRATDATQLPQLAEEQAALRRVATLVARAAPAEMLFAVVAEQVAVLLSLPLVSIVRYEPDGTATERANFSPRGSMFRVGTRWSLEGTNVVAQVRDSGGPARIDDYSGLTGVIAETARRTRIRSTVGIPIVVAGRVWGVMVASSIEPETLPPDTEGRLADFTELVATAIANGEAREEIQRLADEQARLRRVATLVAKEAAPEEVFAKVAEEVANALGKVDCALLRDEGDGSATPVATWGPGMGADFPVGTRLPVDGNGVTASVLREARPCRIDDYSAATGTLARRARERGTRSAIGCPILVRGRVWGVMAVATYPGEPCPPDTETRMAQFADLVATAIANVDARAEVERLAEEQAALRRVATLVAEGASPTAVFDRVAAEMERLLDADQVMLARYERGTELTVVAHRGASARLAPPGTRVSHAGENVQAIVRRTEQPARMDHFEAAHGAIAEYARSLGARAVVGAPVVVDGRLWGVVSGSWNSDEAPPADTEERMAEFAQLLDTAIANADSRDQLRASRARVLTAADEARRRVVRDLHDGAQQRFVLSIIALKLAHQALRENRGDAESILLGALEHAEQGYAALRELAHGIHPAVLTRGGLRAGVRAVVERVDLPVDVDVTAARFPEEIEASAYFIVAEALTNVVKHAKAQRAEVRASVEGGMLRVEVRDDGIGGADPHGHGLVGISDRATALGGRLEIVSPPGNGTVVAASLPLSDR